MIQRFQGDEGRRLLVGALLRQRLVQNDATLAEEIAAVAQLKQFEPNDCLIVQNGTDNHIYFLLAGTTSVRVHGREVKQRTAGDHVGEMAVIDPSERRCATVCALEPTVVAGVSEPEFSALASRYPNLWRYLAVECTSRLRQRNQLVKPKNERPLIFIGSSKEGLSVATAIQAGLDHDNFRVQVWTDDVFRGSRTTMDTLLQVANKADFAILVLSDDDRVISRHKQTIAPRDNVVFELGMFMGVIGQARTLIVKPRGSTLKLPSDVLGITPIDYSTDAGNALAARIGPVCTAIRNIVNELGPV